MKPAVEDRTFFGGESGGGGAIWPPISAPYSAPPRHRMGSFLRVTYSVLIEIDSGHIPPPFKTGNIRNYGAVLAKTRYYLLTPAYRDKEPGLPWAEFLLRRSMGTSFGAGPAP